MQAMATRLALAAVLSLAVAEVSAAGLASPCDAALATSGCGATRGTGAPCEKCLQAHHAELAPCFVPGSDCAVHRCLESYCSGKPVPPPPPATAAYKCVLSACVKTGPASGESFGERRGVYNTSTCDGACAAPTLSSLASLKMQTLAVGEVQPTGWLQLQMQTQVSGLAGHLPRFWPDVHNSSWIHPENHWAETYSDRGGNLPYWLNGIIPTVMQTRSLSDRVDSTGYNLTHTAVVMLRKLVATQEALNASGEPAIWESFNLGTWNVVRSSVLLMSAAPAESKVLLPFVLSYVQAAHQRLKDFGWLGGSPHNNSDVLCTDQAGGGIGEGGYCRFRYVDWMHILQQLLDAHSEQMTASERATVYEHMELIGEWGFDFRSFYAEPCPTNVSTRPCLPMGGCNSRHVADHTGCSNPAWIKNFPYDYSALHGVHGMSMPLKEGTVRWRMTRTQEDADHNEHRVAVLERWQGMPTGAFSADEFIAGREARRGTELCTIVETMYSLGAMAQNGSVSFADRVERIAVNALPAALTADMWSHNYLSMINEVQATTSPIPNPWGLYGISGQNATTYGLADMYTGVTPCCTANHNQGWPKMVQFGVQADMRPASKAIYVVLLFPTNATVRFPGGGGANVSVETEYPFGDSVTVRVRATEAVAVNVRVPTWATKATVSLNGLGHKPAESGAYHSMVCEAGETVLVLELNPDIVVERHWGASEDLQEGSVLIPQTNGVAVTRGPLLFALSLDETVHKMGSPFDRCFESGCSQDVEIKSTEHWAYTLVLPETGNDGGSGDDLLLPNSTVRNPKGWTFKKVASPGKHPFAGRASPTVTITAEARELPSWTMDPKYSSSPQPVPISPVDCGSGGANNCGPVKSVQLVPFGSTRLRMGMLPYTMDE
jgi:hypothetical protein